MQNAKIGDNFVLKLKSHAIFHPSARRALMRSLAFAQVLRAIRYARPGLTVGLSERSVEWSLHVEPI